MSPESTFEFRAPSPPGVGAAHTTSRSAQKWQRFLQPTSFEMRWTVPVPIPSDFATLKIPTPFASCFRIVLNSAQMSVFGDEAEILCLFVFTIGTDPGELGGKEIEGQSTGRFGKRDGSYTGLSQVLAAECTPVENLRLEVSATSIYHDIAGVTGLDDRRRGGWQALSVDLRYRLLDREQTSFGLLIDAEPRWGRIDETSGEPVDQYGIDLVIAIDKELVPNRVVAAFNALYGPEVSRSRVTGITSHESFLG